MWLKSSSHYKVPIQIILFSLAVIGGLGYSLAGELGAENLIIAALMQAVGQFPFGLVVILICSRIFTFDFGTIGTISLKIFSISLFEEAVTMAMALLVGVPPGSIIAAGISFVIFLFMVMILFETTGLETWIIAAVAVLSSYLLSHYLSPMAERQMQQRQGTQQSGARQPGRAGRAKSGR
jgi:hypothetical protein